jgi:Lysylphosphatidylglycerol synthase TM region
VDEQMKIGQAGAAQPSSGRSGAAKKALRNLALKLLGGAVGVTAFALLVRSVGPARLGAMLAASARWLPLLLLLEAVRIGCELAATLAISPRVRRAATLAELARIHLVAYAVSVALPAGRAACETTKGAMLSRRLGVPAAAAIAATGQSLALLGGVILAVPCAVAAFLATGASTMTLAVGLYALGAIVAFALMQLGARRREVGGFLGRRFASLQKAAHSFHDAMDEIPLLPPRALAVVVLSRLVQALQLGLLVHAAGAAFGLGRSFLAMGVSLVGGSVGDMIPGQLGAADGAFALFSRELGIAAAGGVAVAVVMRCVQMAWMGVGLFAALAGRERKGRAGLAPELAADGAPAE